MVGVQLTPKHTSSIGWAIAITVMNPTGSAPVSKYWTRTYHTFMTLNFRVETRPQNITQYCEALSLYWLLFLQGPVNTWCHSLSDERVIERLISIDHSWKRPANDLYTPGFCINKACLKPLWMCVCVWATTPYMQWFTHTSLFGLQVTHYKHNTLL